MPVADRGDVAAAYLSGTEKAGLRRRGNSVDQSENIPEPPHAIRNPGLHGRRDSERHVATDEVVPEEVQADRGL